MRSINLFSLAAAVLVGSAAIATTADAQVPGGYYVAVPAAQPSRASVMTRATPWRLQGTAYVAAKAPERDTVLCDAMARQAGQLQSFTVNGRAFDADQLAKCNAHARGGGVAAAAATVAR